MSNKQYNLPPTQVIASTALAASVTSIPTNIYNKDNVIYQYLWTGTLAGSFTVQTSLDYNPHNPSIATWDTVQIGSGAAAAGTPDHGSIELNQLSAYWIQTIFSYTSGTGNLTATISGKGI
jgi:hypothetical protein